MFIFEFSFHICFRSHAKEEALSIQNKFVLRLRTSCKLVEVFFVCLEAKISFLIETIFALQVMPNKILFISKNSGFQSLGHDPYKVGKGEKMGGSETIQTWAVYF